MATRLEMLRKRREELDQRLKELSVKEGRKTANNAKRQKIIIGGWLMKHRPDLVNNIIQNGLQREQDRKAFQGWIPLPSLHHEQKISGVSTSTDMPPTIK